MIYKVYDSDDGVVFEDKLSRKRHYDLFVLSVTVVNGDFLKIVQLSTSEVIFNKLSFSSVANKKGVSVGDSGQQVKDYIDSVVLGQKTKSCKLSEYSTSTTFSGDVT